MPSWEESYGGRLRKRAGDMTLIVPSVRAMIFNERNDICESFRSAFSKRLKPSKSERQR
jgi:hypothetical protein